MTAKIALLQANPLVGDILGNQMLICELANSAHDAGADFAVTSELVISGYPPKIGRPSTNTSYVVVTISVNVVRALPP